MKQQLCQPVRQIMELLVQGKYKEVEVLTNGIRLNAVEIAKAISGYGRHLAFPPDDAFKIFDVVEVKNSVPSRWSIVAPFWTQEEGRSDLSLELTIIKSNKGFTLELDDIHVL